MATQEDHSATITSGWVHAPNGRGTSDILQSCLLTIFLCTYQATYLNIKPGLSTGYYMLYKLKWILFTLFCPEVITGLAAEQWRSARQSVKAFKALSKSLQDKASREAASAKAVSSHAEQHSSTLARLKARPWTIYHAFFGDMGGIHIKFPDCKAFPVNSHQLLWLVTEGHMEYPSIDKTTILDKNNADFFARATTLFQVSWFTIQCVARGIQGIRLTTLELSTLGFAFCTIHASFFWHKKPFDIDEPLTFHCPKSLSSVLASVNQTLLDPPLYTRTPLDFLKPPPQLSYIEPFFFALQWAFHSDKKGRQLPVTAFDNTDIVPPQGLLLTNVGFAVFFAGLYFGIHLAAWRFHSPTVIEQILWRTTSMALGITVSLSLFGCWPGIYIGRFFFGAERKHVLQQAEAFPRWVSSMYTVPTIVV